MAVAKVQEKGYSPAAVAEFATSGMANFTVGHLIVLNFGGSKGAKVASITGGGVTTWKKAQIAENAESPEDAAEIWYGIVSTGGVNNVITVKFNEATTTFDPLVISEWSGAGTLDKGTKNNGKSASMIATKGKPANEKSLFVAIGRILLKSKVGGTLAAGWTEMSAAGHTGNGSAFIIAAAGGEEAASWTIEEDKWAMAMAIFVPVEVPVNSAVPTITGTPEEGKTLTDVHGTWSNSPSGFSYQWQRCNSEGVFIENIAGATAQTYVLKPADVGFTIRVRETASNAGGSGEGATSAATAVITGLVPVVTKPGPQESNKGVAIPTLTVTATNTPTGWTATNLPTGLSINASGEITGTPTAAAGEYTVGLKAKNGSGESAEVTFVWKINAKLALKKPAEQSNEEGKALTPFQLGETNAGTGVAPFTYSAVSGFPPGLTVKANGKVEGTPSTAGTYATCKLKVEDAEGVTDEVTFTWVITAAPGAPAVVTNAASSIGPVGATLNGTADPEGQLTTAFYEYGLTAGYGSSTPGTVVGSGSTPVSSPEAIVGLAPGTLYHFRICATNASGTTKGGDLTFTTGPAPNAGSVAASQRQQEVLQPGRYLLRHIAPKAAAEGEPGILSPVGAGFVVLGKTLYADELPISRLPSSPDFTDGIYTLRMLDSGDYSLTFPNRDASDGQPWRSRFSVKGHTEFVEISREGEIEKIGVIVKKSPDRQKIVIAGYDGFWLLKKAYEQSWTAVIAPRDLIERYSALPIIPIADEFREEALNLSVWQEEVSAGASLATGPTGLTVTTSAGHAGAQAGPNSLARFGSSGRWSIRTQFTIATQPTEQTIRLRATYASGEKVVLEANPIGSYIGLLGTTAGFTMPQPASLIGSHTMYMECDGRWISGYFDGQLVGVVPVPATLGSGPKVYAEMHNESVGAYSYLITEVVVRELAPFLMRGSEKGDYALPGTANSYPTGGLHGRYIVTGATTSAAKWWETILAPDPRRAGFPDFLQDQQATINSAATAGLPENFWAARWFGAIYLPLSKGDVKIKIGLGPTTVTRLWIGKTQFGAQIIDSWTALGATREIEVTLNAASLGAADGWYPIILEFATGSEGKALDYINLNFNPAAEYTDPGGAVLKTGMKIVPSTSLSPLGCVDARIQGSSFFDLVQETAKNFGYQLRAEPRQLESGEFPCALIPKARVGIETDERIEADDTDRRSGINNYTATEDATDSAGSVRAFGSGIADGKGSQIAFEALSIAEESSDLFDMQAWVAAGDIAFPALLRARAEAELALRLGFWQNIEGEPLARDRLADTFPLTGALAQFRWRPGDGVRLYLPDVNVNDTANRQIMQVTRSFGAEGRTNTQIGFRSRPKDPIAALRVALREATRSQRAYQRQYVTRQANLMQSFLKAGETSNYQIVTLNPGEIVVDARVLIGLNSTAQPCSLEINTSGSFVTQTGELGGPWKSPLSLDIRKFTVPRNPPGENRFFLRFKNEGAAETELDWQLILTLLV